MKENNEQLIYWALSEIAGTFFRFGLGIGEESYIKQYSEFVADVMDIRDRSIIDQAIVAWGRTQTKFDAAAVAFCIEQNTQHYVEMKRPFVANRLVEKPFDYNAFLAKIEERFLVNDIAAIKLKAVLYISEDSSKAVDMFKLAAIWGDTFAIKACEHLADGSDKIFWTELLTTIKNENKVTTPEVLKVARAIKLLQLYEYKSDTVGRNDKKIAECMQNQLQEDQVAEQLTIKEYVDPFGEEGKK